jgi:hypothetical protein
VRFNPNFWAKNKEGTFFLCAQQCSGYIPASFKWFAPSWNNEKQAQTNDPENS